MADATAQLAQQNISWFFQTAGLALDMIQTPADCMAKALAPLDNDPYIKSLNQMIANGDTEHHMMIRIDGESEQDFKKRVDEISGKLKEANVWCHLVRRGDTYEFITLKSEQDKTYDLFENKTQNVSNLELKNISHGNIKEFKTDNIYAAYMFQKRCDANGIPVKIDASTDFKTKEMTYKIRFNAEDIDKINAIKRNVSIDINDEAKELRKAQMDYEMKVSVDNINNTLNLENAGTIIAGKNGTDIRVTPNGVVIIKGEQSETIYKGTNETSIKNFTNRILSEMGKMGVTVAMTQEQYELYQKSDNKRDFLIETERKLGRPEMSESEREIYQKAEQQRSLIEAKLRQYHPEEVRVDLNDYNNFESLSAFKMDEKLNYEASHDYVEGEFKDATILDDARAFDEGIIAEDLEVSIEADELADQIMDAEEIDIEAWSEDRSEELEFDREE